MRMQSVRMRAAGCVGQLQAGLRCCTCWRNFRQNIKELHHYWRKLRQKRFYKSCPRCCCCSCTSIILFYQSICDSLSFSILLSYKMTSIFFTPFSPSLFLSLSLSLACSIPHPLSFLTYPLWQHWLSDLTFILILHFYCNPFSLSLHKIFVWRRLQQKSTSFNLNFKNIRPKHGMIFS